MTEQLIVAVVGTVLAGFVVAFVWGFLGPYFSMRRTIRRATRTLDLAFRAATERGAHVVDLDGIEHELAFRGHLAHLWGEFRDTLHAEKSQTDFDDYGQPLTVRYRQTLPAEMYFSTRALVDVPLRTDFFKHLPGILTGLGIIGTFGGLILGLSQFNVSGDAERVNASVGALVGSVKLAFVASALAITCSIVITVIEKIGLSTLSAEVQRLQQAVDRMFDSGAGEDYLSHIAHESEQSATHLAHLKEGLVNDLKHLLEDFAEKQSVSTRLAAEHIGTTVATALQDPLASMTAAIERSQDDQQQAVQHLMEGALNDFAGRLEEVVGAKLTAAAEDMQGAAGTMRAALVDAPAQVEQAVARVAAVLDDITRNAEPLAANAERISGAADKLATTIEQSSETLDYAIDRFKRLGEGLSASIVSAQEISRALEEGMVGANAVATTLSAAGDALNEAQQRLASVVTALSDIAARTERDGVVQRELSEAVERAAAQLSAAQHEVDGFLNGVAGALAETHETFSREIDATLNRTHEAFHHNLATATEQLAGTVHGFGDFLETDFKDSVDNLHKEVARLGGASNGNGGV